MNSGKVRIYELSKELNLDNKDILAVCEQLNISVKSHSSTITDAEAERIRTAAEKYIANHPASTKAAVSRPVAEARAKTPAPVRKNQKQQILEIRRPTPTVRQPGNVEPPAPPRYSPAPTSQEQQVPQPPTRPASLSRPTEAEIGNGERATAEPPEMIAPPARPSRNLPDEIEQPKQQTEPVQPIPSEPVQEAPKPVQVDPELNELDANQPELIAPPQRPEISVSPPRANLSSRPILKRSRPDPTSTPETSPRPDSGSRPERPTRPTDARRPSRVGGDKSEQQPIRQQPTIVELRRPHPVRSEADEDVADDKMLRGDSGRDAPLELKLKRPTKRDQTAIDAPDARAAVEVQLQTRPTLPRTVKKGKDWQDEEEEAREFAKAPSKVGTKTKRRTQTKLEDEDEDLEILLDDDESNEDDESAAPVSLALMRPAKPKSMRQNPAKPTTTALPQRNKKPSGGSRDRRDRREQSKKVEKPTKITVTGGLTVQELAELMAAPETDIIRTLFFKGIAATITQTLDVPTIEMVAQELGVEVETEEKEAAARKVTEMLDANDLENLQRRPPVVTIMGHVDHGKTTLLDSIRKTKVAQGEAGGITQHIGAYHVDVEHGGKMQQIVFLDTPGHEAFTAMRARGTRVTDIAVLVVAADDGVRPQTIEAISHAKAAEVPIVVAINKVDKEEAQPDRVKQELTEFGLVPEEWGGDTIIVPVSALTGDNLDTLLEMLLLVAEVEDLYANPDREAKGTVIEAHLDKAKGPVATFLVQNGTLKVGDILVAGSVFGKVRALMDDRGKRVNEASPSFAVEVLGLSDVPAAGDEFDAFKDEKEARAIAGNRADEQRQSRLMQAMSSRRVSLNTLSARVQEGDLKELNLVLKADVQGSVEAILGALRQLPQEEVQVRVLYAAPGEISETDVDLAAASDAVIIGFNTTLATGARQAADQAGVDVREYNIIYKLLDEIQAAMEGLLDPELVEEPLGQAEVRAVFPVGRGAVAGCYVQSGKIVRNSKIRVRRGGNVIYEGNLDSLKRMKEDAREVNSGYECGIGVDSFSTWEEGDIIESYRMASKRRTLTK